MQFSNGLFIFTLFLHQGSCGARHRRPPLPHSRHMGSIRPLQSVWALQRASRGWGGDRAGGETMVVELLLPVWHLTSKLAAAKCLDALRDNKNPSTPLGDWWWTAARPVPPIAECQSHLQGQSYDIGICGILTDFSAPWKDVNRPFFFPHRASNVILDCKQSFGQFVSQLHLTCLKSKLNQ